MRLRCQFVDSVFREDSIIFRAYILLSSPQEQYILLVLYPYREILHLSVGLGVPYGT